MFTSYKSRNFLIITLFLTDKTQNIKYNHIEQYGREVKYVARLLIVHITVSTIILDIQTKYMSEAY